MTYDWQEISTDDVIDADGQMPQGYRDAQRMLDSFVEINYETALDAVRLHAGVIDAGHIRQQTVDIIRNNPPLQTVPAYFRDGRENYLWYSDFYDDVPKDVFRQYGRFVAPDIKITPANYATELAKIDLPYFRELVDLVSLEKLYKASDANKPAPASKPIPKKESIPAEVSAPVVAADIANDIRQVEVTIPAAGPKELPSKPAKADPKMSSKLDKAKIRSYEPKMNPNQYALLVKCLNRFEVFRMNITVTVLRELLEGRQAHLLQITNQRTFTYIFDELAKKKLIRKAWIVVSEHNRNFASGPRRGSGETQDKELHYITGQQFSNSRIANKFKYVEDMDDIDVFIRQIAGK